MKNISWWQKTILTICCVTLLVSPGIANAQAVVTDPANLGERITEFFYGIGQNLKKTMGAVAYKNMLSAFLSKMAYDAAVWVASAGTGQETLVYTQPWDEYLVDAADGALGEYVSSLADEAGFEAFNVCAPSDETVRLNLALGLETSLINPDEPDCKISELGANWADVIETDEFGDYFVLSFDPAENEIGTFITLHSTFEELSAVEEEAAKFQRETDGPVGSKTGAISQYIQTPGDWINDSFKSSVEDTKTPYKTYTGEVLADTLNIFSSTLFTKLVERLQGGFIDDPGESLSSLISGQTGGTTGGVAAAKATYATLNQPTFNPGGEVDSAYQLVEEGVIDQTFQLAIENQWQTQEFIDYLNDNVEGGADGYLFGVSSDEISSPSAGITRRGIYLLKKYRIVPVGWQIAADLIYYNRDNADFSGISLGDLADCADGDCLFNNCGIDNEYSEFCKLVDPDWVLKSPQAYCAKESYGLTTVYDDFLDQDGNEYNQDEHVLTREQECVDEMTCINEDSEGNCYDYGYCVKDKRTYQFEGEGCTEEVASCQGYERQSDGVEVNYLTNTLNYGDCNDDDALGCTWYCQSEGSIDGSWGCLSATESYTECNEDTGTENEYCYCDAEETCDVDIYSDTCTVDTGETCTLSETCSPENESYFGTGCSCSLTDFAYMDLGDSDGIVTTDTYGWDCSLSDTATCETTSDSYFTYTTCESTTCTDNCTIFDGYYSCENDAAEECYLARETNEPEDLATVYLNDQREECSSADAGCTEYIEARENNILFNSSFEDYDYIENDNDLGVCSELGDAYLDPTASPYCSNDSYCNGGTCEGWNGGRTVGTVEVNDTTAISETSYGSSFIHLSGTGGVLGQTINYDDYSLADRTFVISLQAYSASTCDLYIGLAGTDNDYRSALVAELTGDEIWTTYTSDPITFPSDETGTELTLGIANVCDVYIDAVQLEEAASASSYADYGTGGLVYLNEEVVECQSSEVGCQLYTPTTGKFTEEVPGVITNELSDACTGADGFADPECSQCSEDYVGCDYYQEQALDQTVPLSGNTASGVLSAIGATTGTQSRLAINDRTGSYCYADQTTSCYNDSDCGTAGPCLDSISIVPSTASSCSASAVGCESYTNLGTVAEGGEGTEYYSYLKQCVTSADTEVDTYYSWEGSDESGYQLKSHTLKQATDGAPCTNLDLTSEDYNASCIDGTVTTANDCSADYGTDPDCILYYNADGDEFYRYEEEVIGVDDECIPLRNDNDGRTYYMLPDSSTSCSSVDVGCREYKGSEGADVKLLINDDFSDCSTGDWVAGGTTALDTPSESVYVDDCSLTIADSYYPLYTTDDEGEVTPYLESGNSYVVTFWAKGSDSVFIGLDLDGDAANDYYFTEDGSSTTATPIALDSDWTEYTLGPLFLESTPDDSSNLVVEYAGTGYFDSFYLQESESQYLIQGSADLCQGYEGCQTYQDEDSNEYYLKSFERLCEEEKVGCDLVYNSQNTSENPYAKRYNLSNEYSEDDLIIPTDSIDYLVLDEDNECSPDQKGCQTLGEPDVDDQTGEVSSWATTYLINDPDSYDSILCQYQHLDCLEYESPYDGMVYFKDPGDKTCYFDSTDNVWYKNDTTEACDLFNPDDSPSQPMGSVCDSQSGDLEGEYCQEDDDCDTGRCIDTNSDSGWVGTCDSEDSGCTQYSDPYTGEELMTNYSFEYDQIDNATGSSYDEGDTADNEPDYWQDVASYSFSGQVIDQQDVLDNLGLSSVSACSTFEMTESSTYHYSNSLELAGTSCLVLAENLISVDTNETYNIGFYIDTEDDYFDLKAGLLYYDGTNTSLLTAEEAQNYLVISSTEQDSDYGWTYYHGTIGHGQGVEFPAETTEVWPFIYVGDQSVYVDEFSFKLEEDYYYLDYTIDGTEEGSVSETTTDECITGINEGEGCLAFRDNTREDLSYLASGEDCTACVYGNDSDTCTAAAGACDTNTVIKVRPDRVCEQWIDCYYYNEVTSDDGEETELECLGLGICEGINDEGDCVQWAELPTTPDGNDDLTYVSQADAQSVDELDDIKNYTGYSKIGMVWPSIKSCDGGYEDGQSCDSDTDCEDRGACEDNGRLFACVGGSLSGSICTVDEDCHNDSQDGTCSGQFEVQGYYPYAAMVEYGDLDDEVITDGGFEDLYCDGGSKVDTDSKCIVNSHCNNTEIKSYNESSTDGTCATCTELVEGTDYYCKNNYAASSTGRWDFETWEAEGDADLMVVQYSEDETYTGDSRYNETDNIGDSFSDATATYAQDWNNVLKVDVSSDSAEGVKHTALDGYIVNDNTYSLSFKGMYTAGFDDDDVLNVGLRHTDSGGSTYTDWFAKGDGMLDIVFIVENSGSVTGFKGALIAGLDDIESNMPEGVSYRAALVESNATGANLIEDLTTLDNFETSLSGLSGSSLVGNTCNLDAIYNTVNDSLDSGSITYRSEAERIIVLVTNTDPSESSSCDYGSGSQEIATDLLSSEDASYYIFASLPFGNAYRSIAEYVSGSSDYINDSSSSDYSSVMASMVATETENLEQFQMSGSWTDYALGPLTIVEKPDGNEVSTDLVIYQSSDSSGADFIIDDVSLLPTLEVNADLDTITRDCRAYPEDSSLSCSYYEGGGNYYRGWMGYCLEYDPEDDNNCLVWWPTDRIKGESFISSLRTDAGYDDRSPVYNCLVSKGYAQAGFCVDAVDIDHDYYAAGTPYSAPTVDYIDSNDHDYTICGSDSDCGSGQICFEGANLEAMVEIGSNATSGADARDVSFDEGFADHEYMTLRTDVTTYFSDRDIGVLETENYTATSRKFVAPVVGKDYTLADGSIHTESDPWNHASIYRYAANPLERNIHLSEVESIILDPGSSGSLHDTNQNESDAFSPRAGLGASSINITDGQSDWGLGSGQTAPGDITTFCQEHDTSVPYGDEGAGCYWVRQYNNDEDDSVDVVYTYAYGAWKDTGDDFSSCVANYGLESAIGDTYNGTGDTADVCDGYLSPQVAQIVGTGDYSEESAIESYQNPWEHLGVFSGLSDYNDDVTNIRNNFGASGSGINVSNEYFILGENDDEGQWFRAFDTSGGVENYGGNVVSLMFDFDSDGYLANIYAMTWFGAKRTGDSPGSTWVAAPSYNNPMQLTYYLREPCAVIAKSVDTDGSTYSWSSRVTEEGYTLPASLNIYDMYDQVDDEPFGAIPPYPNISAAPSDGWDGIIVSSSTDLTISGSEAPLVMDDGENFNAGWPISCIGDCGTRICSNNYIDHCDTDDDCGDGHCIGAGGLCEDLSSGTTTGFCDADLGCASGERCRSFGMSGTGYEEGSDYDTQTSAVITEALTRYKYLFAEPLAVYTSSIDGDGYSWETADVDFNSFANMIQCSDNERVVDTSYETAVDSTSEYCGILPGLANDEIKVNGYSSGEVRVDKSQKITLSFDSEVDSEQLPLEKIYIDWFGDTWDEEWNDHDWGYGATYHSYSWYSSCSKTSSNYCLDGTYLDSSAGTCDYDGYCVYKPRVSIVDHWGWASGEDGGADNRASYESSYTLGSDPVYDEFDGVLLVSP